MTSTRSRREALSPTQDVGQSNSQQTVMAPSTHTSSSTKRSSTKQENLNFNFLSSIQDKSNPAEAILWSSLPAKLLRPGKVQ